MKNQFRLPTVKVISVKQENDFVVTEIEILTKQNYFGHTIAPGNLLSEYEDNVKTKFDFPVHKVIFFEKNKVIFETYESPSALPKIGTKYLFLSNFMDSQMELVKDTTTVWKKKLLPEHICTCDLTWENTHGKENEKHYWYTNGKNWITPEAYIKYIKNDILRVRKI